jgi:hypothetical protein
VLLLLPVLCGLWWYCTMGAPLGEGVNPVDRYSRGARMLGAMLGSRAGLALIGSIYMSGLLAFASLAVAIPLIFLKSMRRPK